MRQARFISRETGYKSNANNGQEFPFLPKPFAARKLLKTCLADGTSGGFHNFANRRDHGLLKPNDVPAFIQNLCRAREKPSKFFALRKSVTGKT
jgi:hypothetical protein